MRAQFSKTGNSNYHLKLHPNILPAITINVPSGAGVLLQSGRGVVFADVNVAWWGLQIQKLMQSADPTHLPLYLTSDVLLYSGDIFNCCTIGCHGAGSANGNGKQPVQTFAWPLICRPLSTLDRMAAPPGQYRISTIGRYTLMRDLNPFPGFRQPATGC